MSKSAFVLGSVMGCSLIINRYDYDPELKISGVGYDLLERGEHEPAIAFIVSQLAMEMRAQRGDGVVIVDGGANIGHLTCMWARRMDGASDHPWGKVIAFEAQEWIFRQLAGNTCLNNCFNTELHHAALHSCSNVPLRIPYDVPWIPKNFGGISLVEGRNYRVPTRVVNAMAIDSLGLDRCDIIKLDIEGWEPQALAGAQETLRRCKPVIIAETHICETRNLRKYLDDYEIVVDGSANMCAIHKEDDLPIFREACAAWKKNPNSQAA